MSVDILGDKFCIILIISHSDTGEFQKKHFKPSWCTCNPRTKTALCSLLKHGYNKT